jgi:hypothetical protein
MKPEGNRVGRCVSWNEKPQRPIGYKEEAKADSNGCILLQSYYLRVKYFFIEQLS